MGRGCPSDSSQQLLCSGPLVGFLSQPAIQATSSEHLLCAGCSKRKANQEGSPFWFLSASPGLGPAITHVPTGPSFRWGLKDPRGPLFPPSTGLASLAPKSSYETQGSPMPGQLTCLIGHSTPQEDFLTMEPPSPGRKSAPSPPPCPPPPTAPPQAPRRLVC